MSGTSAGAYRGWKTRRGLAQPVGYGRKKNPIRQKAGEAAHRTRKLHEGNRSGAVRVSNQDLKVIRRMEVRGQISGKEADKLIRLNQMKYEHDLRMNPVRHRKRGR